MTPSTKIHYRPVVGYARTLWCSGRSVLYSQTTTDATEVSCGSCLRKMAKAVR